VKVHKASRGRIGNRIKLSTVLSLAALAAVQAASVSSIHAASLTWNSTNTGVPVDGAGTWNTTTKHWYNGSTDGDWVNGDIAVFGATTPLTGAGAYAVFVASNTVIAGGLTFNAVTGESANGLYTIGTTGTNALTLSSGAYIDLAANVTNPANAQAIIGGTGLTATGAITISGENASAATGGGYGGGLEITGNNSSGFQASVSIMTRPQERYQCLS